VLSLFVTATVAVACGARTGLDVPTSDGRGGSGGATVSGSGGALTGGGGISGTGGHLPPPDDCADAGTTFIYVVTDDREIYAFDPPSNTFMDRGKLPCAPSGAQSMAVDRSGHAYIESNDFRIVRVSLANLAGCVETRFMNFGPAEFGMAFSSDQDGGGETLYLTGHANSKNDLVSVNVGDFNVDKIGVFSKNIGDAELTGTGDSRLFAYGVNGPGGKSHLAQIDKETAEVLNDTILPFEGSDAWAFAWWGGDFYFFTSTGGPSTVRRLDPMGHVTEVATAPGEIVGAGVSTCAPVD
jgi:hypothetical protein